MGDRCHYARSKVSFSFLSERLQIKSVTPILSRVVERLDVKDFIAPLIPADVLGDQFGFEPTGGTTAALILANIIS